MHFSLNKSIQVALLTSSIFLASSFTSTTYAAGWLDVLTVGADMAAIYQKQHEDIQHLDTTGRDKMLQQQKEATGVDTSWQDNQQLKQIMQRFNSALTPVEPTVKAKPFNYYLNPRKEFNAFCTLGHNLSINKGIFDFTNRNTDEIAAVIAHEMAHGIKEHPKKGAYKSMNIQVLQNIYAIQNPSYLSLLGTKIVANNLENRGVTKPMEKEADNYSFHYLVNAGFNIGAPAALWQRIIDKEGVHKSLFIGELFSPSTHPGHVWRRDNFSKKLTEYSHNKVTVNPKTGMIQLNKKDFIIPSPAGDMTPQERAYLIAGNLSAVYHNNPTAPNATQQGNYIYMDKQPIMSLTAKDNPIQILEKLNAIK